MRYMEFTEDKIILVNERDTLVVDRRSDTGRRFEAFRVQRRSLLLQLAELENQVRGTIDEIIAQMTGKKP